MEPDAQEWLTWARRQDIHPLVLGYVEAAPDVFEAPNVNPRALEYAWRVIKGLEVRGGLGGAQLEILAAAISGLVGETIAASLIRFMSGTPRPLNTEDILGRYAFARPCVQRWARGGRLDLLQAGVAQLQQQLDAQKAWDALQADPARAANLSRFLQDLPPDMRCAFDAWLQNRGYLKRERLA